jgi:hypothetical protein
MNEYVGNLHVHSTYSDGTGTIEDIAHAAEKAGVDFVCVSDHHTLAGLDEGKEGWHGKALILIGMEVGTEHNHYLAWRINKVVPDNQANPQSVIDAVRKQGGIGFIAHPFEKGCKYGYSGKAFTWDNWNVRGHTGICIWNFVSQWKGPITNPLKAVYYFFYRRGAVKGPDKETLAMWDEQLRKGRVAAIGGTDAHAFRFGFAGIRPQIFPYEYLFRTINTHILTIDKLTGDIKHDREVVYSALEHGRSFVSFDLLGDGRGFEFTAFNGSKKAVMGDEIGLEDGVKLSVQLPRPAHVRVIRDGVPWREGFGGMHIYTAKKPGVYRVEVTMKGLGGTRPWIFSNPIYVRP